MNSTVFYFTGTGNSLYIAKNLSDNLGIPMYSMAVECPFKQIGGAGTVIGFVFPSYYGNLPRIVRNFISNININPESWIFAVVAMGGVGEGSVAALEKALNEKGLKLRYGRGLHTPANYIMMYNPASVEKGAKWNIAAEKKLKAIANDIKVRRELIRKNPITASNLYKNIESLDAAFYTDDKCVGCGQCEKICPVRNIKITDGKPKWLHRCEHCAACIQWCPKQSIQYGKKTVKRRRYINPAINISELKN